MSADKKVRRKKELQEKKDMLDNPLIELNNILKDTVPVIEHAEEIKASLQGFLDKMDENGEPHNLVSESLQNIVKTLDNEITVIQTACHDSDQVAIDFEAATDDSVKFDLSNTALDIATTVMTSSVNIGTILSDLAEAKQKLAEPINDGSK